MENEKKKSKGKEIALSILAYIVLWLISFGILILLIRSPLFSGMEVLMYRGIIMIVISGLTAALLAFGFRKLAKAGWLDVKDYICTFIICCCVNMVFFTLVPVTVERSVSVFMLSYMDSAADNHFTEEEIKEIFVDKYVNEFGAFQKRFSEQIETGTIEDNGDGTYSITDTGRTVAGMFRLISDIYKTDERLVYPMGK